MRCTVYSGVYVYMYIHGLMKTPALLFTLLLLPYVFCLFQEPDRHVGVLLKVFINVLYLGAPDHAKIAIVLSS